MNRSAQLQRRPHESAPYHHGDLARALVEAGSDILTESGVDALTLRAVTRRAGVSATAATPHFGNLTGLRSAIAAKGYETLATRLNAAKGGSTLEAGMTYIGFARANSDLFRLMFRRTMLDFSSPALAEASARALSALETLAGQAPGDGSSPARMAGLWGRVHGLAVLAIDGTLIPFLGDDSDETVMDFLRRALGEGGSAR